MSDSIAQIIQQQSGGDQLIQLLSEKLSGTELNSLLMEVFAARTSRLTPSELLRQYKNNRFVQPAETNYLALLETTLRTLKVFNENGFIPQHLSPLVPAGTCSVIATVDQDKVVSGLRGCEVLSDASNALALHIALQKKIKKIQVDREDHIKYSAVQRHVRAQQINIKGYSPHFTIGCIVSSGVDPGDFKFEKRALREHFTTWSRTLSQVFNITIKHFKILKRGGYNDNFITTIVKYLQEEFKNVLIHVEDDAKENNYYQGIQFKVVIELGGRELEIADGGLVDWTQKLLNNKKERYCISGFGLELLNKFNEGLL